VSARHDEEGTPAVQAIEILGRNLAQETHAGPETQGRRLVLQTRQVIAAADDHEFGTRVSAHYVAPDLEKEVVAFVPLLFGRPPDDECVAAIRTVILPTELRKTGMTDRNFGARERRIGLSKLRFGMPRDRDEASGPSKRGQLESRKRFPGLYPDEEVDQACPSLHHGKCDRKQVRV
jgi:hypothetical protein